MNYKQYCYPCLVFEELTSGVCFSNIPDTEYLLYFVWLIWNVHYRELNFKKKTWMKVDLTICYGRPLLFFKKKILLE